MIINSTTPLCTDLLVVQLEDGLLDISWSVDTDTIKSYLDSTCERILNFNELIDFDIEIDNVDTFDSINLKTYKFSEVEKKYIGNIVFSAIIPFNKNKFEETNYYIRIKINETSTAYNVFKDNQQNILSIEFVDKWIDSSSFSIRKNYTKDIIEDMYRMVADFNAYNKEVKSANFYYLFQAFAVALNEEYSYMQDLHSNYFIDKILPDNLKESFGELFKFTDVYGLSMEEYRRILKRLIIAYQNGGAWNYIKEVLKYLIGHTPELFTLKNFYPWILRKAEIVEYLTDGTPIYNWNRPDPENFSDRNYYNPESNYYLFSENYDKFKNKNSTMLMAGNERLFTFIVKAENFFNRDIDQEKIKAILDILKSAYTKYSLNIKDKIDVEKLDNDLLVSDNNYLLANDADIIKF